MASSVKFNGTEILTTTFVPRFIKHEPAPDRELTLLALAREDGAILVAEKYGTKRIMLAGNIKASNRTNLETDVDLFKELFSRKEKNLDISWAGGTRRYVATCIRHYFDRDYWNEIYMPWTAEFVVATGIGEDTSETTLESETTFTAAAKSGTWTFKGSYDPRPRIRVKCDAGATDPKGLSIENTDTDERIVITRSSGFGAGKYFEVDCRLKTASYDSVARTFYGVFPSFDIGVNNYEIKIGDVVDQAHTTRTGTDDYACHSTVKVAQSFMVANTDSTYEGVKLYLRRFGVLVNDLTWRIETDTSGEPSTTLVNANATGTVAKGDVDLTYAWHTSNATAAVTLTANTRYWLVLSTTAGDATHHYVVPYETGENATYKKGNAAVYTAATWFDYPNNDLLFQILFCGKANAAKTYEFDVFYYKRYL